MNIYYQWIRWAYSHIASTVAYQNIDLCLSDVIWLDSFASVWEKINSWFIGVLPVENSYAWSVHENLYNFLRFNVKVIWEISLPIHHCLLSKEKDIKNIKEVYSHPQALSQCYNFLKKHNMEPISYQDTASAAKMVSKSNKSWIAAIASEESWKIYWLNIVKKWIEDQKWNTTRFFVVVKNNINIPYKEKKSKITILFEAKNIPASLYKCLWAFATNNINLTKIESIPSLKNPFTYIFWVDFQWQLKQSNVQEALRELKFFTESIKIVGEY